MFQKGFQGMNMLEDVLEVFLGCFKDVSRKPQACFKRTLCVSRWSIKHAPILFQELNMRNDFSVKSKH